MFWPLPGVSPGRLYTKANQKNLNSMNSYGFINCFENATSTQNKLYWQIPKYNVLIKRFFKIYWDDPWTFIQWGVSQHPLMSQSLNAVQPPYCIHDKEILLSILYFMKSIITIIRNLDYYCHYTIWCVIYLTLSSELFKPVDLWLKLYWLARYYL